MKAAYLNAQGGPEVLTYGDLPDPVAGAGQVVVDIIAASVNGADWKVRSGSYAKLSKFPYILGRDFSGTVSAVGEGVTDFKIGDEVFGVCDVGQEGAYATKIAMKASLVAKKPTDMPHEVAAALALTGLTALVSIEDTIKLKKGEKILIQGGAGGVAAFGIELAKHLGAYVVTTASAGNHDYVRKLGADEVIDYNKVDVAKAVKDCDAAFDTVGLETAAGSFAALKPGGRAAFIGAGNAAPVPPNDKLQSLRPNVGRDRPHLERIVELYKIGAVHAPEMKTFPLSQAAEAHRISEGRHFRGKLIFLTK